MTTLRISIWSHIVQTSDGKSTNFATKEKIEFKQSTATRARLQMFHKCFEVKIEQNMTCKMHRNT